MATAQVHAQTAWRLVPLIFFQLYLNFSLLTFAFGPWPWPVTNSVELYGYLIAAHLFLAIGYLLGLRGHWHLRSPRVTNVKRVFVLSLLVSIALILPTAFARTGSLVPDFAGAVEDLGDAYSRAVLRRQAGGEHVVIEYVRIATSPLLALVLPLLVVYWTVFSRLLRMLASIAVLWFVSVYVVTGTNKGIADFLLILPWLFLLRYFAMGGRELPVLRLCLATLAATALTLVFFTIGQLEREGGAALGSIFGSPLYIHADPEHWITGRLPDEVRIAVESILRYLNGGYYALSRCFRLDFDSTFGVGNSMFLSRNFDAVFATNWTLTATYPAKLEIAEGWGTFQLWHSVYPWLASDFGFPGSLFVVGLLGWLFAASWVTAVDSKHPAAISLFAYLCIALYYFPGNNQLMQSGESCIGFLLTLLWWIAAMLRPRLGRLTENRHVLVPSQ